MNYHFVGASIASPFLRFPFAVERGLAMLAPTEVRKTEISIIIK